MKPLDRRHVQNLGGAILSRLYNGETARMPVGQAYAVLDLVAVFAGLKRAALIPLQDIPERRWPAIRAILPPHEAIVVPQWVVGDELAGLPDWYAEGVRTGRRRPPVRLLWAAKGRPPNIPPDGAVAEAELLSYPACCVREYYRRRRLYHRFTLKRVRHFAGTDEAKARALVASEVAFSPSTAAERAAFAAATGFVMAPFTSMAMCRACAASADTPPRRISAACRHLATEIGLADLLSPEGRILSAGN